MDIQRNGVKYSIVIPTHNSAKSLDACLKSLYDQTIASNDFEVIVIDDGSNDNTQEVVRKYSEPKYYYQEQQGPASSRNLGIEKAKGEVVLFTDADCELSRNWVEEMINPFQKNGIVGVKGMYGTRQNEIVARFAQIEYEEKFEKMKKQEYIDFVDTYSAAYRRDILKKFGGFDTSFPMATGEDADLSFKIAEAGHKMIFNPRAIVYHNHPDTLWRYFKRKIKQPYWRLKVYWNHPGKIYQDSHTPQSSKVQIILMLIFLVSALGLLWNKTFVYGLYISAGLFGLSVIPFFIKSWRKDKVVVLLSPLLLFFRAFAFALGLIAGMVAFPFRFTK